MNGLGGPVDARGRSLWLFSSYFNSVAPQGQADGSGLPGVPVQQDPRYGSPGRPGYYKGSPQVLSFSPAAIEGRYRDHADALGNMPYLHGTLGWGFLKKIGRAVGKIAKKAGKIPGVSMIPYASTAIAIGKKAGKLSKKKRRKKRRGGGRRSGGACALSHKDIDQIIRRLRTGRLKGLGALRPTVSFALGAPAAGDATVQLARAAADRVARFIQKVGSPPAVKLPEVELFQEADGKLNPDGLWGNNAISAAAWYLNADPQALPPTRWRKGVVTWTPPVRAVEAPPAPPPVVMAPPAPPPVVMAPPAPPPVVMAPPAPPPVVMAPPPAQMPIIKTAIDAPAIDKPREATALDLVELEEYEDTPPVPRAQALPAAQAAIDQARAQGAPLIMPPLVQRVTAGDPPLSSDKAVAAMPPPPVAPAPPFYPGGEGSQPVPKGRSKDNTWLWLVGLYAWQRRKA